MSLLLFQCWYSNKINVFNRKIYLEVLFGLALVCFTPRFLVVLNSQQIITFLVYSTYIDPIIVIIIDICLFICCCC